MTERHIDARGLACPEPVIRTRNAMNEPGVDTVRVLVDEDVSAENILRMAATLGWQATQQWDGAGFQVLVTRGAAESGQPQASAVPMPAERPAQIVVCFTSAVLGVGDDELGRVLMRAFVKTLKELDPRPNLLIFLNSGVRLTTKGSDLIGELQGLEAAGVRVLSCGTCLDYYRLKDALEVGAVTNMFEIASALVAADRVVRP